MASKPRVFIGSSAESLKIAEAVLYNLDHMAEVTPWSASFFELSADILDSLLESLDKFDFAVFVFSPDDVLKIRGEKLRAPRDNVVFELGLFIGRLGRHRSFVVIPRGAQDLRLPTDLAGFTPGTYEANRSDGNLKAALVHACSDIKDAIAKHGLRSERDKILQPEFTVPKASDISLGILDQSFTKPHNLGGTINEGSFIAQTYTAGVTGRLAGVNVNIRSYRSMNPDQEWPDERLRLAIYSIEGDFPAEPLTETILASDEAPLDKFVEFPSQVGQAAGGKYAIVASFPGARPHGAGHGLATWSGSSDDSYEGGNLCYSKDGLSWFMSGLNQNDLHFRTYVTPDYHQG